jgi:hypothetical protein
LDDSLELNWPAVNNYREYSNDECCNNSGNFIRIETERKEQQIIRNMLNDRINHESNMDDKNSRKFMFTYIKDTLLGGETTPVIGHPEFSAYLYGYRTFGWNQCGITFTNTLAAAISEANMISNTMRQYNDPDNFAEVLYGYCFPGATNEETAFINGWDPELISDVLSTDDHDLFQILWEPKEQTF